MIWHEIPENHYYSYMASKSRNRHYSYGDVEFFQDTILGQPVTICRMLTRHFMAGGSASSYDSAIREIHNMLAGNTPPKPSTMGTFQNLVDRGTFTRNPKTGTLPCSNCKEQPSLKNSLSCQDCIDLFEKGGQR
tara:strand:- start:36 stop:437 length:402 start_codon:yes stop_codon:yes gene_type:complete